MQRQMPRLRTKTGCSPCRLSKKKCDEIFPTCRRCQVGGRTCEWPNAAELSDRRRLTRRPLVKDNGGPKAPELTLNDSALVQVTSARAIETVLSRHFTFGFYELILLPGCSPHFFTGWLTQLCQLAKRCPSLYNSLLACAASHLYLMDGADSMLQLGLTYYSNAIRQLLKSLANDGQSRDNDGLLSAIIFLIVHGVRDLPCFIDLLVRPPTFCIYEATAMATANVNQCQGVQTFDDIPNHMGAASRILLEVLNPQDSPKRYLDDVLVESILFHSFHACTGLWSDPDPGLQYGFDAALWRKAESYLSDADDSSGNKLRSQGPVLGVPTSLLRLALQLRQLYRNPLAFSTKEIQNLQAEGLAWENQVLFDMETPSTRADEPTDAAADDCCQDISTLYVLAVSLLLSHISNTYLPGQSPNGARPWQLKLAAEIIQKHASDQRWQRSYMGNWPVYTLGSFAQNSGARVAMQTDLQRRWTLTKMGQSKRFLDDMQEMWDKSDFGSPCWPCGYGALEYPISGTELCSPGISQTH